MMEEGIDTHVPVDRTKVAVVNIVLCICPAMTVISMFFNLWTLTQTGGGPTIGAMMFAVFSLGCAMFVVLSIWWFRWVRTDVADQQPIEVG